MRIRSLQFSFTIFFILLGACLFNLQIVRGSLYKDLSYKNSIRLLSIAAPRGTVYDRHGKVTADNALSFGVFIVPQEAKDLDAEIEKLSEILDVPESLLKRNYKRSYHAPFAPCEVMGNVPKKKAILIEELKLDMPGVLIKEMPLRRYAYKEALAHILGYVGEIDKKELASLKSYGYSVKDLIGKDGMEKVMDAVLRGRSGGMQVQVDNRGRQVKVLNFKGPKKGNDIHLTIDAGLQDFVWRMMKDKMGAAVFMDPHTGEILTMISAPSYDPNDSVIKLLNDAAAPLLNRSIMGQYPPGSLFKIVVAMAGLETGKLHQEKTFFCSGRLNVGAGRFNCWNRDGHGAMDLEMGIIQSCNVYFYNVGMLVGMEKICEYARQFGFGRKTGIGLFGEEEGFVPSRAWKRAEKKGRWYAGDTANLSIGQGYLLVTPLQVVRLVSCIANGGVLVEPYILKGAAGGHTKTDLRLKKKNIDLVKKGMKGVVEADGGTGFRAWSSVVSISAKTGTAQAGGSLKSHAWFAGFAPSDDPKISFVIFLEHGGSGGGVAAMIAKKAVEYWYKNR